MAKKYGTKEILWYIEIALNITVYAELHWDYLRFSRILTSYM